MPSAVAVLTVAGLALLVACAALIALALGGMLAAVAAGAGTAGAACLLTGWLVELDRRRR